jgi:threonine/homoserine/homoserine lactone efflux protein
MPDSTAYLAFLGISALLIAMPGPNVLLVIATALAHGHRQGLVIVAGTSCAMVIQLAVAAAGNALLATALSEVFAWVKWAGAAYLIWLGIQNLRAMGRREALPAATRAGFWQGFWVSLTNPKTILFFGAFLPQFVTPGQPAAPQLALLSASFLLLAVVLDSSYALACGKLGRLARSQRLARIRHGVTGVVLVGAGAVLAASNKQ